MSALDENTVEEIRKKIDGKKYCSVEIQIQDGKVVHFKVAENFKL